MVPTINLAKVWLYLNWGHQTNCKASQSSLGLSWMWVLLTHLGRLSSYFRSKNSLKRFQSITEISQNYWQMWSSCFSVLLTSKIQLVNLEANFEVHLTHKNRSMEHALSMCILWSLWFNLNSFLICVPCYKAVKKDSRVLVY